MRHARRMTTAFPEDLARRTTLKRPSYALGVLLNLLLMYWLLFLPR